MPGYNYAFTSGTETVPAFGQKSKVRLYGTWAVGDTWTLGFDSTSGKFTLGRGNLAGLTPACGLTFKDRIYMGCGLTLSFSAIEDATGWEEQNVGAGNVSLLSNYGAQDSIYALATIQGRLAVFGRRQVQIWTVAADPSQFALAQTMDNIGTKATESVKSVGDMDVYFLDETGIRSLRTREVTLNAYSDDIGLPIDTIVRAAMSGYAWENACSVVEPTSKRYWLYLNGTIYVLSNFRSSKIQAWSTYKPTHYVDGEMVAFVPTKFVVKDGIVYCRASDGKIFQYNANEFDQCVAVVETPWLDLKGEAHSDNINATIKGSWTIQTSMDPNSGTLETAFAGGDKVTPNSAKDSTYDIGKVGVSQRGTHVKMKAFTALDSTKAAVLSSFQFNYEKI